MLVLGSRSREQNASGQKSFLPRCSGAVSRLACPVEMHRGSKQQKPSRLPAGAIYTKFATLRTWLHEAFARVSNEELTEMERHYLRFVERLTSRMKKKNTKKLYSSIHIYIFIMKRN